MTAIYVICHTKPSQKPTALYTLERLIELLGIDLSIPSVGSKFEVIDSPVEGEWDAVICNCVNTITATIRIYNSPAYLDLDRPYLTVNQE